MQAAAARARVEVTRFTKLHRFLQFSVMTGYLLTHPLPRADGHAMQRERTHDLEPTSKRAACAALLSTVSATTLIMGFVLVVVGAPGVSRAAPRETRVAAAQAAPVGTEVTTSSTSTTTHPALEWAPPLPPPPAIAPPAPPAVATDCTDALEYLAAHAAPGFISSCESGSALGHYGFTCWNVEGVCPQGARIIHIACPAPFVYQNEAHNSWALLGERSGIDPYGQGNPAEQSFCDRYR